MKYLTISIILVGCAMMARADYEIRWSTNSPIQQEYTFPASPEQCRLLEKLNALKAEIEAKIEALEARVKVLEAKPVKDAPELAKCPCEGLKDCKCDTETGDYTFSDGCNSSMCNAYGFCTNTAISCLKDWRDVPIRRGATYYFMNGFWHPIGGDGGGKP